MFRLTSKTMKIPVIEANDEPSTPPQGSNTTDIPNDTVLIDAPALQEESDPSSIANKGRNDDGCNLVVIDGSLTYNNITETSKEEDELSLLTTMSQDSIDISFLNTTNKTDATVEESSNKHDLSFHASQVDSSDLNTMELTTTDMGVAPNSEKAESTTSESHNHVEVLVNVGKQLLREEESKKEKKTTSWAHYFKFFVVGIMAIAAIWGKGAISLNRLSEDVGSFDLTETTDNIDNVLPSSAPAQNATLLEDNEETIVHVEDYRAAFDLTKTADIIDNVLPSTVLAQNATLLEDDEATIVYVEEYKTEEKEEETRLQARQIAWQVVLFGCVVLLSLSKMPTTATDQQSKNHSPQEKEEETHHKADVKTEESILEYCDLSKYEELKVVQLREKLRSRKCKTVGKKAVLIHRLAAVYEAELETLTVRQLRPILKSRGCKQAGLKVELIRKLVEWGV